MAKKKKKATEAETAVATKAPAALVLAKANFALAKFSLDQLVESVKENFEDEELGPNDLDRIRVPSGGALAWSIPDIDEGEKSAKTIEGVMLMYRTARAYWSVGMDEGGGNLPPDCSSQDGKHGGGTPGGICKDCPLNQFGSGKGRGKACKEMRLVFFLMPGSLLPSVVVMPPTSISSLKKYLGRLTNNALSYRRVVTSISLNGTQNKDGIKYAQAVFDVAKSGKDRLILDTESAKRIGEYAEAFKGSFEAVQIDVTSADYSTEDSANF